MRVRKLEKTICTVLLAPTLLASPAVAQQKRMMKIGDDLVSVQVGRTFDRAQDLIGAKQFDQAAVLLKSLVETQPNLANIRFKYGYALLQQNKNSEALEQAKKCVELAPKFVGGWTILGEAYLNLNQSEQARDAYRKALALDPHGENADVIRERIKDIDNPPEKSAPEMVEDPKSAEENRKKMKINQALALCDKAAQLAKQNQFEQGLQECRNALKIAPDSDQIKENFAVFVINYAASCVQTQKLDQAEALMKEVVAFQARGGVSSHTQQTALKNYAALLNFLNRPDEANKIEERMKSISNSK